MFLVYIATGVFLFNALYKLIWIPQTLLTVLRTQNIPSTKRNFPFGQSLEIFFNSKLEGIKELYNRNREALGRTYIMFLGTLPVLNTADPDLIKQILVLKQSCYERADSFKTILRLLSGESLIVLDGVDHREMRKKFNSVFSHQYVEEMTTKFSSCCHETLLYWEKQCSGNKIQIDPFDEFTKLTMDCLCSICFGYQCSRMDSSQVKNKVCFGVASALRWLQCFFAFYHPLFQRLVNWMGRATVGGASKSLEEMADSVVEKYIRNHSFDQSFPNDLLGNILHQSFASTEGGETKLTKKQIISNVKLFFIVGHDTTTSSLSWTLYLLAKNPDWQERLRESIKTTCGDAPLTKQNIKDIPLLTMVINESLRMYPPVVGVIRKAVKDHQLGDISIPKGMNVSMSAFAMHYDPALWKEDPSVFNPSRFSNGTAGAVNHSMAFLPFGAGKQNCIGQTFALLQMHLVIGMILQKFRISVDGIHSHVEPSLRLTLKARNNMRLTLEKLEKENQCTLPKEDLKYKAVVVA